MRKPSPPQSRSGKIFYLFWNNLPRLILAGMIVLIVVLMIQIRKQKNLLADQKAAELKNTRNPVNAVVLPIKPGTVISRLNLPGIIEPWADLNLKAKVGGTITQVLVKEGDHVHKGELLAKIEDNDYQIAVDQAKTAWQLAEAEYKRDKTIFDKGIIAASSFDSRKATKESAAADYENARLQLSRTSIISPMDGIIQHLNAKVGLQLAPGDNVARILQINKVKAIVGIPESDVEAVNSLDTVLVKIQALDNLQVKGRKLFLSPAPTTSARVYQLELEIDNPEEKILTGMFVRADIIKERKDNSVAIPLYSIITRNNEQYVFVEKDGTAVKKNVSLGIMEGWMVEITEGLNAGDHLIVEGHRAVEDGQKVEVIKAIDNIKKLRK